MKLLEASFCAFLKNRCWQIIKIVRRRQKKSRNRFEYQKAYVGQLEHKRKLNNLLELYTVSNPDNLSEKKNFLYWSEA